MDIDFEQGVNWIQDLRAHLAVWGVDNHSLVLAGVFAAVVMVLSLREVVTWFLRVHALRREIGDLRSEIAGLKASVDQLREFFAVEETGHPFSAHTMEIVDNDDDAGDSKDSDESADASVAFPKFRLKGPLRNN